jgi:hypothetical protein
MLDEAQDRIGVLKTIKKSASPRGETPIFFAFRTGRAFHPQEKPPRGAQVDSDCRPVCATQAETSLATFSDEPHLGHGGMSSRLAGRISSKQNWQVLHWNS